jgi:hypothetical protein
MANTKRKSTGALSRKRKARRGKARGFGALAIPKKEVILDSLKKTGYVALGFLGGRLIDQKVFPDESGFKRYVSTAIQLGGGVLLCTQKNETLRYIGYGVTGSGAVSAAEKILNKPILPLADDLLAGFSLGDVFSKKTDPKIEAPYIPQLPEIAGDPVAEDFEEADQVSDSGNSQII